MIGPGRRNSSVEADMDGILATRNRNAHRPFHIYSGHTYFITGRCKERLPFFLSHKRKRLFQKVLKESSERFGIGIFAWAVLHNHYHLLCSLRRDRFRREAQSVTPNNDGDGKYSMVEFIRKLHKDTARVINKEDHVLGREVWYQYWDYCIRNKPDFWRHFNYIFQQPLKHGLVKSLPAAYDYPYSSNQVWVERFGRSGMSECLEKYPVKDWTPTIDDE